MREMLNTDEEHIDDLERENEALRDRITELAAENHRLGQRSTRITKLSWR